MDTTDLTQNTHTPIQSLTSEMAQQMIIYVFSYLGLLGNPYLYHLFDNLILRLPIKQ